MHYPICFYVIVRNIRSRFACIGDTVCNRIHATPLQSQLPYLVQLWRFFLQTFLCMLYLMKLHYFQCMPTQNKVDVEITLSNHDFLHAHSYQEHSSSWNGCSIILPGTVLMKSASHLLHSWLPMYSLLCSNRHHLPLWIVSVNSLIWSSLCI